MRDFFLKGLVGEQVTEVQAWSAERRERSTVEKESTPKPWSVPYISSSGQYLIFITEALVSKYLAFHQIFQKKRSMQNYFRKK